MTAVYAREGEPFEKLLRRFKTGVQQSGIRAEVRRRKRFRSAQEIRRAKVAAFKRRQAKQLKREGG